MQLFLSRYMVAIGALSLRVDQRTQERFRMMHQAGPGNPDFHRRRSVSMALDNIAANV